MRFFLMFFLVLFLKPCVACVCDEIGVLDLQVCSSYDVIFIGKVNKIQSCEHGNSTVVFDVSEAYKGNIDYSCEVNYTCGIEDCSMDFQEDTEWLIFLDKNNAQENVFDLCSHSRQLLPDSAVLYSNEIHGSTFFQDKQFLDSNFDVNKSFRNELEARKYEAVDPILIPVFLGVSLGFMLVGMFVFKRIARKKKNDVGQN